MASSVSVGTLLLERHFPFLNWFLVFTRILLHSLIVLHVSLAAWEFSLSGGPPPPPHHLPEKVETVEIIIGANSSLCAAAAV